MNKDRPKRKPHLNPQNLQPQSERNNFRLAGLPCMLLRKPKDTYRRGLELVEKLKEIEAQLTEWEDKQPLELLELLPWWEDRKKYREQKALGNVPEVTWWEALAFVEGAKPTDLTNGYQWRISKRGRGEWTPFRKKKGPKTL